MKDRAKYFWIFGATVFAYLLIFAWLTHLDKTIDLDGNPLTSFPVHGGDSLEYTLLAQYLLEHHVFLDTFRTPGYPFFLAVIQFLFGSWKAAALIQIVLVFFSAFLISKIGTKFFSKKVGRVAALFYLWNPATLFHSMALLSETFFIFWILLAVYCLFVSEMRTGRRGLTAGVALGCAVWVRPLAVFLPILFGIFWVAQYWKKESLKKGLVGLMIFGFGFTATVAPWIVRNYKVHGVAALSSMGPCLAVRFHLPMFFAAKYNRNILNIPPEIYPLAAVGNMDCRFENSRYEKKLFWKYFSQQPWEYTFFHLASTPALLLSSNFKTLIYDFPILQQKLEQRGWLGKRPGYFLTHLLSSGRWQEVRDFYKNPMGLVFLLEHLFWGILLLLAAGSLLRFRKEGLFFFLLILYFAVLQAPATGPRYRLPADPFLFLLTVAGGKYFWERIKWSNDKYQDLSKTTLPFSE